jgi:hypothetical protein
MASSYFDADAAGRNIDDEAFEPWRVRRGNDEARPPVLNTLVPALAEVFTVSHCCPPLRDNVANFLRGG